MKRTAIIIFLISAILLNAEGKHEDGLTMVSNAFEKPDIEFLRYDINGCVKLNRLYTSREEMENLAQDILESVEPEHESVKTIYEEENEKLTAEASIPGGSARVVAYIVEDTPDRGNYSTVVLDITRYEDLRNINDIGERILNCLSLLGYKPSINLCITGYNRGRIPESRKDFIIEEMMSVLKGKSVDSVCSNGLKSICAYSEYIPYFMKYKNDRVNLNIACRYSSFDDRTYFWIGTPIISIEY